MLPSLRPEQRTPITLPYYFYNQVGPVESRSPKFEGIINHNRDVLASPSVESLVVHFILGMLPNWSLKDHKALLEFYFVQRNRKSGFRASKLFEGGIILALAARYRTSGASRRRWVSCRLLPTTSSIFQSSHLLNISLPRRSLSIGAC